MFRPITAVLLGRLGSARLLGHDDLIDAQHRTGGRRREANAQVLGDVEVKDATLESVTHVSAFGQYVEAGVLLALVVRRL